MFAHNILHTYMGSIILKVPLLTWKQILTSGIGVSSLIYVLHIHTGYWFVNLGIILIAEHSFFLHQQNDSQSFCTAADKYKALNMHNKVEKALKETFRKYNKMSLDEKIHMVNKVLHENRMYVFHNIY